MRLTVWLMTWVVPAALAAGDPSQPAPPALAAPQPERLRLTGDWGGLRTAAQDHGVSVSAFSTHYYGFNLRGGADTHNAQRYSATYDLIVQFDLDAMRLIPGGEILLHTQGWFGRGGNINDKVGALGDPIDDADGHKDIYIDQLWYQQTFGKGLAQLRFGYLDMQTILDRNAFANAEDKQFFNTYLDNNNAVVPLTIGLGATVFLQPTPWLGFVVGAADGKGRAFDDGFKTTFHDEAHFFGYFETDLRLTLPSPAGPLPGTYRIGLIYDPNRRRRYHPDQPEDAEFRSGDYGFYLSCDQWVYRERPGEDQGLGLFARYGFRDGRRNAIEHFWSAGAQYAGPLPQRDRDVLGFGVYSVHASDEYQQVADADFSRETGFELYYAIQVTPWMTLTPDIQYIVQPGGSRDAADSIVFAVRARWTL